MSETKLVVLYTEGGREPDSAFGIYDDIEEAEEAMYAEALSQVGPYRPGHSVVLMEHGGMHDVWTYGYHALHEDPEPIMSYMIVEIPADAPGVA